jgi:hypothetical protein
MLKNKMPYSQIHRFLKKYDMPYYYRLSVKTIAEMSGLPEDILQEVYDREYKVCSKDHNSIMRVCAFINRRDTLKQCDCDLWKKIDDRNKDE